MLQIGMQTKNIIEDANSLEGFLQLKSAGFSCVDFSLNSYLINKDLYKGEVNDFFDKSVEELEEYFAPHKKAAESTGIRVHQMHMPYPIYIPNGETEINDYLWKVVAPKSMHICKFFNCKYMVVHGFKLARFLGSESLEWEKTEAFIHYLAPMAKELGITLCIENLYNSIGGHIIEGPCCDVENTIERIDSINAQYNAEVLGFCFDTGHANLVGIDFYDFITRLSHRIKVLHIHDNDGVRDLHQIPYSFTRTRENKPSTDWEGFIKGLREIGFDGVLNFETSPVVSSFPDEMKADVLAFLVKIGCYFSSEIRKK